MNGDSYRILIIVNKLERLTELKDRYEELLQQGVWEAKYGTILEDKNLMYVLPEHMKSACECERAITLIK